MAHEFRRLLDGGAELRPAGSARRNPARLLAQGYVPRHKLRIFDTTFYLTDARQNPELRFYVAYLLQGSGERHAAIYPRIFYKDVSLVWRSASHYVRSDGAIWIGKGETRVVEEDGEELVTSDEATSDLPFEIQTALETCVRRTPRIVENHVGIDLVLRRGPENRVEPYRDFSEPRRRARANPKNRVNRGRSVARFRRRNDPSSLRIAPGFEPDFRRGILERSSSLSRLYGGRLRRFRIASRNREIQYLFFAGPRQVWIAPPQATTTELSSYGVRTIDVEADENLSIPGYEYHFFDADAEPPALFSQIPEGFAGDPAPGDAERCDASAWIDRMPVVREFRRTVLGQRGARAG